MYNLPIDKCHVFDLGKIHVGIAEKKPAKTGIKKQVIPRQENNDSPPESSPGCMDAPPAYIF